MQLARAGSSGLASSTVALKLKCAFGSSGLERMGLVGGDLEMPNCRQEKAPRWPVASPSGM
jgi:hypothetical protein